MPKVSVMLGLTLPGAQEYSSFRAEFRIGDIDTDGDVEQQLKDALEAGDSATVSAEAGLAQAAANASGLTLDGSGLAEQFFAFKKKFGPSWKKLVKRVNALTGDGVLEDGVEVEDEEDDEEEKPAKPKARAAAKSRSGRRGK